MTHIPVPKSLLGSDYTAYSADGDARKEAFHRDGKKFLRQVAESLGLEPSSYDLRNNKGGIAVSGEVTLHTDELYVQISESSTKPSLSVLYRTCKGRADYSGGANNFATMAQLAEPEEQKRFLARLAAMSPAARAAATRTQIVADLREAPAAPMRPSTPRPRV